MVVRGLVSSVVILLAGLSAPPAAPGSATLTVTTDVDADRRDDHLSLREALLLTAFDADLGADGGVGMYCLTAGEAAALDGVNLLVAPVAGAAAPLPCLYDPAVETRYRIDPADPGVGVGVANHIVFAPGVGAIFVTGSALPPLEAGSGIDGASGGNKVLLAGDFIANGSGLTLGSCCDAPTTVRNLMVRNFPAHGIEGASQRGSMLQGLVIFGSGGDAIRLAGATEIRIGGPTDADRNVVHGNEGNGITILDPAGPDGALNNRIQNNIIGLLPNGRDPSANGGDGIALLDAVGTLIVGNTISANRGNGVRISGAGAVSNQVLANAIGTDPAAAVAHGNGGNGVQIDGGAHSNIIGLPGAANVISGNGASGVALSGAGTASNMVERNSIGTDGAGTAAIANRASGVVIDGGADANTVAGNLISGNLQHGILIRGAGTATNTVSGNRIGTNADRTGPIGNGGHGILIAGSARFNTVSSATVAYNGGAGAAVLAGSFGNTLNFIAVHTNGGLGIDLDDDGVGCAGGDSGGNRCSAAPLVAEATSRDVRGSAPTAARVAIYLADGDASGYGEGRELLTTVTADRNGAWSAHFTPSLCTTHGTGLRVTATATVAGAGTSEFAQNVALTCLPDDTATPTRTSDPSAIGTATPTATPPVTEPPPCPGDCDGEGTVRVDELVQMVNIDLGLRPVADCPPGDSDASGQITVDEVLRAVKSALFGCD